MGLRPPCSTLVSGLRVMTQYKNENARPVPGIIGPPFLVPSLGVQEKDVAIPVDYGEVRSPTAADSGGANWDRRLPGGLRGTVDGRPPVSRVSRRRRAHINLQGLQAGKLRRTV